MFIPWKSLRNPVVSLNNWILKDACMMHREEWFYLYFSAIFEDRGDERFHVTAVKTRDFQTFSEPLFLWSGPEAGGRGFASPDLQLIDGTYYLTYCTYGETKNGLAPPVKNQLYYATSVDGETWDAHRPLVANLNRDIRAIDPTMTRVGNTWYVVWKQDQTPKIACSDAPDSTHWRMLGSPDAGYFENAQIISLEGRRHLLFSDNMHSPCLAPLSDDWLGWADRRRLDIPGEAWNTDVCANAAFIADWREHDGYFYAIYCGRTRGDWHSDGDYRLGLARSRNLLTWRLPGDCA